MKDNKYDVKSKGITFLEGLFFVFLTLKLADKIDWSWWWVFSPLWVPAALVVLILGVMAVGVLVSSIISKSKNNDKEGLK